MTTQPPKRPGVGVAAFIVRPIKPKSSTTTAAPSSPSTTTTHPSPSTLEFIIGLRRGSHGSGTWALPGGHIEYGESIETTTAREVHEETGLTVTNVRFLTATNDVFEKEGKHYVTVFVVAEVDESGEGRGEPVIMEPEKCEAWEWVQWETMVGWVEKGEGPERGRDLFLPLVNIVRQRPGVVPSLL